MTHLELQPAHKTNCRLIQTKKFMHIEPRKIDEIKITIKHLEYQVGTCAASLWLDGAS